MQRPHRGTLVLVAGDLAMLVLFAVLGRRSHEEAAGLEAVRGILGTAAPFLLGWLLALAWTARSRSPRPSTLMEAATFTARAWGVAFPLAVLIRAAALARFSPWTFYVVAGLVTLALLVAWRVAFVAANRGTNGQRGRGGDAARASRSSLSR